MSSPLPTVVLVHGAWHQPQHYEPLVSLLQSNGLTVEAPRLPSGGSGCELQEDVDAVHRILEELVAAGKEVVVIAHSYGGIPTTIAIDKKWVGKGKGEAGVKALVYIASFALPAKGLSLKDAIGGTFPDWMEVRGDQIHTQPSATEAFYNGVATEKVAVAEKLLLTQSLPSFITPASQVASDLDGLDKLYVGCEEDQAIPFAGQTAMAQAGGARLVKLSCGHSPWLREGELAELGKIVDEVARK